MFTVHLQILQTQQKGLISKQMLRLGVAIDFKSIATRCTVIIIFAKSLGASS